ncbi:MAG: hypothetical protein AAB629_02685 [Patescibacteria group bacterium]
MLSILITRPRYEPATHYLYHWSALIVEAADNGENKVFDLEKEKANRKNVESYLVKRTPEIVIFNGHGNQYSMAGQDGEDLIVAGQNADLLKGCVVYMRACSAGKILGIEIMKLGAKSFIGYREPFHFYKTEKMYFHRPLEDDYAYPFLETSNQVGLSLVKGKTAKDADEDSRKVCRNIISRLLTSNASNSFVIPALLWNMHHQVCYK